MNDKSTSPQTNNVDEVEDVRSAPETAPEATSEAPPGASSETRDRLAEVEAELTAVKNQLLRQVAEFQNYRRRTEKEQGSLVQLGQSQVILPMLDVLDDFRRSLDAAELTAQQQEDPTGPAYEALQTGVELVYQKFMDALGKLGVDAIPAVGEPFDETWHEAVMQQPSPAGTPSNTVLEEMQKGYRLGDRVLRHSKVVVSR